MRSVAAMVGAILSFNRRRMTWALALSIVASLMEGLGLALLVPILGFAIGMDGARDSINVLGVTLPYVAQVSIALAVFVGVALIAAWLGWRRNVITSAIRNDFVADLSKRVQAAVLRMRPDAAAREDRVTLTHLMTIDVEMVGQAVHFLFAATAQLTRIPALTLVIVALSPPAAMAAAAILALAVLVALPFDQRAKASGAALIGHGKQMLSRADESLASAPLIKTHLAEERWIARHAQAVDARFGVLHDLAAGQASARAVGTASGAIGVAIVVWIALVVLDEPLAQTAVLIFALSRLLPAAVQFHASWRSALSAVPSHQRVTAMINTATTKRETEVPAAMGKGPAAVAIQNVSIARVASGSPVIRSGNLELRPRELLVIMGRSGAGKTTLALGLAGLLPMTGGHVHLDGETLDGDARMALRQAAVMVPQDPVLLNDTVAANLRLAKAQAPETAMWDALDTVGADAFVRGLPEGLETVIGDRGTRLSGGERQRIALAQALVARPRLLVLDEATSALDADAEDRVLTSILALRAETTVAFVTHRTEIARRADRVVVVANGQVVADGPWGDIEAERDLWARL